MSCAGRCTYNHIAVEPQAEDRRPGVMEYWSDGSIEIQSPPGAEAECLQTRTRTAVSPAVCRSRSRAVHWTGCGWPVEAVATKGMYLGWCAATPNGPVQVLYRAAGGGVWSFDCLEGGPR